MDPQTLKDIGLTEEQIEALMELGVLNENRSIIDKKMEMARGLRRPGASGVYTGKTFTNASPLSAISRGIGNAMSTYQQQQALVEQRENAQKMAQLRMQYLRAALQRQQQPQRPASPQVPGATPGIVSQQPTAQGMFPMPGGAR